MPTNNRKKVAPYGSWVSPIRAEQIASAMVGLSAIHVDGGDVYWNEMRPAEGGRYVVMRRRADGTVEEATPAGCSARTRVHEYGGGAYLPVGGVVFFSNFADQKLYRHRVGDLGPAVPLTGEGYRYADFEWDDRRARLICVREDHTVAGREPVNSVVAVDPIGGDSGTILAGGNDFYAAPHLSPDGCKLAFLTWSHPRMPWDGSELWLAGVRADGSLEHAVLVAGGPHESICQPEWSPDGVLHFVSDRTDWWNLYRFRDGRVEQLTGLRAEFAAPAWVFDVRLYDFASAGEIVCAYSQDGLWRLARLDCGTRSLVPMPAPETAIGCVRIGGESVYTLGGAPDAAAAIVRTDLASGRRQVLRRATDLVIDPGYIARPEPVEFPTAGERTAYGIFYPPTNKDCDGPMSDRPPLVVMIHGGPTAASSVALRPGIQFYTSRGVAVLDVNYGGSTGYGRQYRRRLYGQWGIVDVDDCCAGARFLAQRGDVDGERMAITGGSAGGYTALAALAFRDVFAAGASHFGVSDCEVLAKETHKFESRYLDTLIGPYPQRRDLYVERSPLHHVDRIRRPVIFFQGLEDKIVPPDQAEMMFAALKRNGVPTAYVPFAGEQHGFRQAANIRRALEAELWFFAWAFGFSPADEIEPVKVENAAKKDDRELRE